MHIDFSKGYWDNFFILVKKSNPNLPDNLIDVIEPTGIEDVSGNDDNSRSRTNINNNYKPNTKVTFKVKDDKYKWDNPVLLYRRLDINKQWELLQREGTKEDIKDSFEARAWVEKRMGITTDGIAIRIEPSEKKIIVQVHPYNMCYLEGTLEIPYGV